MLFYTGGQRQMFDVISGCLMTFVLLADVEQEKCWADLYDLEIVLQYA